VRAIPPDIFALVSLEIGSCFLLGWSRLWSSYFRLFSVTGTLWDGVLQIFLAWNFDSLDHSLLIVWSVRCVPTPNTHLHSTAIGWDGVSWTFCPGWSSTAIFPISASQVLQVFIYFFETESSDASQVGNPPTCWDYRWVSPHPAHCLE
jgi:hypothetical protein